MIRLIITDMDGTLLHNDKSMPKDIFRLIEQLQQRHIHFAAASGRQYASLRESFQQYASQMHFIAENGAVIADGSDNSIIETHPLPLCDIGEMIRLARSLPDTEIVVCCPTVAYYESDSPILQANIAPYYHARKRVKDLTAIQEDIAKLAVLNIRGTAQYVYPHFSSFAKHLSIVVSSFEWMDIMMPNVHKGIGVKALQQRLHIRKDETMAFGDFMNDYQLLQEAAYSYAMKNALPQIKQIANYETKYTNEEDGVIQTIKEVLDL